MQFLRATRQMVVKIGGRRMFLWRAVDSEGEVLDMLVQKRRNKAAALRLLLRKLLRGQGVAPEAPAPAYPAPRSNSCRCRRASSAVSKMCGATSRCFSASPSFVRRKPLVV